MRNLTNILAVALLIGAAGLAPWPVIAADSAASAATGTTDPSAVNPPLAIGDPAPPILATDLKGQPVSLQQFLGMPVVLEFGSLTDPIFRKHCPAVEKLAAANSQKAKFVLLYQHEAHPAGANDDLQINVQEGFAIAAPVNLEERIKLANQAAARLDLTAETILVDAWNDTTSKRYGGLANLTVLIDARGKIAAVYPWMDPAKLAGALDDVLSGKPVSEAHSGPLRSSGAAIAVEENTDVLGPAHFASVVDNLQLSEQQRQSVYPILADYVGQIRTLRLARGGKAAAKTTATTAPAPASQATPAVQPAPAPAAPELSPAEIRAKVIQATVDFEANLKPLLSAEQYAQLIQGLNHPLGGKKKQQ